jgi:hypothetical protein
MESDYGSELGKLCKSLLHIFKQSAWRYAAIRQNFTDADETIVRII